LALALFFASAFVLSGNAEAAKNSPKSAAHKSAPAKPAPGECQPTPDQASIGIRALQTDLMVAGLKCSAEQFNAFTAKFKATIKIDADRMQKLFSRSYGSGGASRMNGFVTQLANDASERSNGMSDDEFCRQSAALFEKVLALTGAELERFSALRSLTVAAPVALCTPAPEPSPTLVVSTGAPAVQGAPATP
jgi:hypothetical protein